MTFLPGLVSISFRALKPEEIITWSKKSGLSAVEWGGDVHVPSGNAGTALAVGEATRKAGLRMPEYGSYYKIGYNDPHDIEGVINSANLLGTRTIRLWAYTKSVSAASPAEYEAAVADAKRICSLAPDMTFSLECHNGSLTEEYHGALQFLKDVACPNFKMFWQPNQFRTHEYNLEALEALLPYIRAVHVFSWEGQDGKNVMFPLAHHAARWREYMAILKNAPVEELPMMLEFMHDGRPESLPAAAGTLLEWIG